MLNGLLVMSVIRSLEREYKLPAVNAVIPQLVGRSAYAVQRHQCNNQSIVNFAAPAAAGAVFAISTLRMTLMIDIVTAILGTGLLSVWHFETNIYRRPASFLTKKIGVKYALQTNNWKAFNHLRTIHFLCVQQAAILQDFLFGKYSVILTGILPQWK